LFVSAIGIDGADSDLVRQRSFVPLMHELVFGLSQTASDRNIGLTQPLIIRQLPCQPLTLSVTTPEGKDVTARRSKQGSQLTWRLERLKLSGIYSVKLDCENLDGRATERPFYAFASREESDLTRMSPEQLQDFEDTLGLTWRSNARAVLNELATASSGLEIWPCLLFVVTAFLVIELYLTRRLVQGGHHQIEEEPANSLAT